MIWPTLLIGNEQGIMGKWNQHSQLGYSLFVDSAGCISVKIGDGSATYTVSTNLPMLTRHWYLVRATYDQDNGTLSVSQQPVAPKPGSQFSQGTIQVSDPITFDQAGFLIAGWDSCDSDDEATVT